MMSNMGPGQEPDTEIQTLKDAIDDVVDIYASLGKTQERIVTSIMKKPRTTDMFVAFISILSEKLNGFTLLELKVKKLEDLLNEAICTKKEILKKQTHLEGQISDILACSTLHDMKTMLKQLVKDCEIPTIVRTQATKTSTDQLQSRDYVLSPNVDDRTIKDNKQLVEKADHSADLDITQHCDTENNIKIEMNTASHSDNTVDYNDPRAGDHRADDPAADVRVLVGQCESRS